MDDTKKSETQVRGRRDFLKLAGISAPAAVAAASLAPQSVAADTQVDAGEGLRKTAHVQAYLDSARF